MRLAPVIRLGFHGLWPAMAAVLLACDMNQPPSSASLAIVNARVWTGDSARPWAEAIAINGDTIVAVGSSAEVRKLGAERVVDAKGGMVTPGFIDSHVHFVTGGFRLSSVQLRDAKTPEEFVRAHSRVCGNSPCRHLDHRRRLGSRAMGRSVART